MIDWEYANLFYGSHDKQWDFLDMTPDSSLVITNENIVSESISFERGMCENDTYFYGTYSSACMKVNVLMPEERFVGKRFLVQIRLDNHALQIGYFTCASDKLSSDRRSRELVMYDDLYKLNEIDVAGWYKDFFEETDPEDAYLVTFRLAFFEHLGIECETYDSQGTALANDFVLIKKATDFRTLSASAVLKSILAFNFQNGMMTNLGKFRFMRVKEYDIHMAPPDPHIDIIPDAVIGISGFYTCNYEDYQVWNADNMRLVIDPDHIIYPVPSGGTPLPQHGNTLSVSYDNMFFRNMDEHDIVQTLTHAWSEVTRRVSFTPMEISMRGNLCYEPGDLIEVDIDNKTLYTVIIKQTFTGLQGLSMTIVSRGEEKFSNPLTVESTSYDDYAGGSYDSGDSIRYIPVTLALADWDAISKTQTVSVSGIDADETAQLIQPMPTILSMADFMSAQILCINQAQNSLTFSYNTAPSHDIDLYIVVQSVTRSVVTEPEPEEQEEET